ncbi:MAG: hypothetical protein DME07_15330 [Candidatus Rokuibacteriota bacterium]|nr:MAG: hypothetical protein DME07_15330 [Candidatus Rokubacteria bacterium]PYN55185.1 MAG: hypothetical protein DMD94_12225 [Candidatus Rokubacteria bacterium]
MTYPPGLPLIFVLLILLGLLIFLVEMRILTYAYRKVGVHPRYAFAVMVLSLLGSYVNIPLYAAPGRTVVALNVGGALIPILVSLYLVAHTGMLGPMLIGTAVVAAIVHQIAYVVPGLGIAVPMLVPPIVAAGVALVLAFRRAPPVAYVSGSMGTLIGADLLNLRQFWRLGAPMVSIGGAGTFDGVFLTGILAGLLA